MKLEKKVYLCTECALGYYKQIWEPMWLAKIMWKRAHDQEHTLENLTDISQDYRNGLEDGRDKIIELIPDYMKTVLTFGHETASKQLIALIKGQNSKPSNHAR